MSQNALQIVQRVCGGLGLPRPNSLIGSNDATVVKMVEILHEEGSQLSRRYPWQELTWECTFTSIADEDQGSINSMISAAAAQAGFYEIISETMWDRTAGVPVGGPLTSQEWQQYKAGTFTSPYQQYRILRDHLYVSPSPAVGSTIAFEFTSRSWMLNGNDYRELLLDDEDEPLLDPDFVIAGMKWRWLRSQGLGYQELFNAYEAMVSTAIGKNGTRRARDLAGRTRDTTGLQKAIGRTIGG